MAITTPLVFELRQGLARRQGFTRKGLQSRSASLLIKSYEWMKEEIKLIIVLAQKSSHTEETVSSNIWRKQRRMSCGGRPRVDGCSGKDMLLVLYIISTVTLRDCCIQTRLAAWP